MLVGLFPVSIGVAFFLTDGAVTGIVAGIPISVPVLRSWSVPGSFPISVRGLRSVGVPRSDSVIVGGAIIAIQLANIADFSSV